MKKTIVVVSCDRCESEIEVASHVLTLDDLVYDTDLCKPCLIAETQRLHRIGQFRRDESRTAEGRRQSAACRVWAASRGMVVAEHGRIPGKVRDAWIKAGRPGADRPALKLAQ